MKTTSKKPAKKSVQKKTKGNVVKAKPDAAQGLRKLFINELKDIYWAEIALTKAIPKMIKNASSTNLVNALTGHLEVTKVQVTRLEEVFSSLGEKAVAKKCEAMTGLIKEAEEMMKDTERGIVRDEGIILAGQKVEHYEIATYGTLCSFAKTLGENKAATLLETTLNEEKEADEKLSEVAASFIKGMETTYEKSIDVINNLIEINNDRIEGYNHASNETKESDLKTLFSKLVETSNKCKEELIAEVQKLGGIPIEGTRTSGKFFRVWMDLKAALTNNDRKGILNSCEFGEDVAVKNYEDTLKHNHLSSDLYHMISKQYVLIKADHDKIKNLRDAQRTPGERKQLNKNYAKSHPQQRINGNGVKHKPDAAEGLRELFVEELKDIYWAEQALAKSIPKMIKNAASSDLVNALTSHLKITKVQVTRLEKVFSSIREKAVAKKCEAMTGLIKEAEEIMKETEKGVVRDAGIILAGQKEEHYEIATYGTLYSFAKTLGEHNAIALLEEILNEAKETDKKLSKIAESSINLQAAHKNENGNDRMLAVKAKIK